MKTFSFVFFLILYCFQANSQETTKPYWINGGYTCALGYSSSLLNIPFGLSMFFFNNNEAKLIDGVYFDMKFSPSKSKGTPRGHEVYPNISPAQAQAWGDKLIRSEESSTKSFIMSNVGLCFQGKKLMLNVGMGMTIKTDIEAYYSQYYDKLHILGANGYYWIRNKPDEDKSGIFPNLNCKVSYLLSSSIYFVIGGDSTPPGLELGLGFVF